MILILLLSFKVMFWSVVDHVHMLSHKIIAAENVLSSSDTVTVQTSEDITYRLVLIYVNKPTLLAVIKV